MSSVTMVRWPVRVQAPMKRRMLGWWRFIIMSTSRLKSASVSSSMSCFVSTFTATSLPCSFPRNTSPNAPLPSILPRSICAGSISQRAEPALRAFFSASYLRMRSSSSLHHT